MTIAVVAVLALACVNAPVHAADVCAAGVVPRDDSEIAYRSRGEVYCEGLYAKPVSAAGLALVGFHRHPPQFSSSDNNKEASPLQIQVETTSRNAPFQVRALSTRRRLYYRMDAELNNAGTFMWAREVIDHDEVRLRPHELALMACKDACDVRVREIYPVSLTGAELVPDDNLRVTANQRPTQRPTLVFLSEVDLEALYITCVDNERNISIHSCNKDVASEGGLNIESENELESIVPAGTPIPVAVDLDAGYYKLEAVALPRGMIVPLDRVTATIVLP